MLARLLPLLVLPLHPVLPGAPQDDELVRDFRRYFKKYEDTPTRVEAILALEGIQSPDVVDVLVPLLDDEASEVVDAGVRVLSGFEGGAPVEALLERVEEERSEEVLLGLLEVLATARYEGAGGRLLELVEERSWPLRRGALRALLSIEGTGATPTALTLVADPEPAVACAAIDGLAELGAAEVVPAALGRLDDEVWQVRASAIAALATVRRRESIAPLIERLAAEEGRLREDVGRSLDSITGKTFGRRLELWRSFWERYGETFEIPTDEELARLRKVQAERAEAYDTPADTVSFAGVDSPSRSIVFVVDVSGSMEQEVVEKERYRDKGYPSFQRMDIVKTELARTIEKLESYVQFNILAFATEVTPWKKGLVKANPLNRSSALTFVDRLEAIGGASKEDLAHVGLVTSSRLEEGRTNTHGAMMAALSMGQRRGRTVVPVDTIFFLSDGRPSAGRFIETADVLRELQRANETRRVVIHTLAIGEFKREFMRALAAGSGGTYVDLGR